jgi:hypothetical protein
MMVLGKPYGRQVAPPTTANVPAAQVVHTLALEAPRAVEYVPAAQLLQKPEMPVPVE